MDIKKSFGVDKKHAEEGKWFDLEDGGSVLVARYGNPSWTAELVRLRKPHLAAIRMNTLSDEIITEIAVKSMAKTILLDWKGISIDGEDFHYSREHAEQLLTDFPEFREAIAIIAGERRNYGVEDITGK
jgi:hypothetical protein